MKQQLVTLAQINEAAERISSEIRHTPLVFSSELSSLCNAEIFLKLENHQLTGSFKARGACNKLSSIQAAEGNRGVVAASAGNHALGLSYFGQKLNVPVRVIMPRFAPIIKASRCRAMGAVIELVGDRFDDARAHALEIAEREELVFVPGFDDAQVIAGQGTLGLEIAKSGATFDAVLVPVGGGGLLAGVMTVLEALCPKTQVIGVEAKSAPTLSTALELGRTTRVGVKRGLADGLAVAQVGELPFRILQSSPPPVQTVDETEILRAIVKLLETEKTVVEGAGAVGLAYALRKPPELAGRRVCICCTGGNIDMNIVARIIERGLASEQRLLRITVEVEDTPGALRRLVAVLSENGANILEITHNRHFAPLDVTKVPVTVVVETRDGEHIDTLHDALARAGWVASTY